MSDSVNFKRSQLQNCQPNDPSCFLQVVKLARKYDPDGIRTLGVVTKCDDAAKAEASDVVEKAFSLLGDDGCVERLLNKQLKNESAA